jgi:hypothetical protein
MKSILVLLPALAFSAFLSPSAAFAAGASSLAGKWSIHSSIAGNESDMVCTFAQTDNKLSGSCKSDDKDLQITGSLDDKKVTWKYESDYNGTPLTVTYTATLGDSDKFTGTVDVQPFDVTGEFTATASKETK